MQWLPALGNDPRCSTGSPLLRACRVMHVPVLLTRCDAPRAGNAGFWRGALALCLAASLLVGCGGGSGAAPLWARHRCARLLFSKPTCRATRHLAGAVIGKLLGGQAATALRGDIVDAVNLIVVPALAANGSNQASVKAAWRNRVNTAVLLALASPEFLVQKRGFLAAHSRGSGPPWSRGCQCRVVQVGVAPAGQYLQRISARPATRYRRTWGASSGSQAGAAHPGSAPHPRGPIS